LFIYTDLLLANNKNSHLKES